MDRVDVDSGSDSHSKRVIGFLIGECTYMYTAYQHKYALNTQTVVKLSLHVCCALCNCYQPKYSSCSLDNTMAYVWFEKITFLLSQQTCMS